MLTNVWPFHSVAVFVRASGKQLFFCDSKCFHIQHGRVGSSCFSNLSLSGAANRVCTLYKMDRAVTFVHSVDGKSCLLKLA